MKKNYLDCYAIKCGCYIVSLDGEPKTRNRFVMMTSIHVYMRTISYYILSRYPLNVGFVFEVFLSRRRLRTGACVIRASHRVCTKYKYWFHRARVCAETYIPTHTALTRA